MDNGIKIRKHKHIVFCFEHYNPLDVVRSLGENNISPCAIVIKSSRKITSVSKYINKCYYVDSIQDGYTVLLNHYGNEKNKPFIYTSDDQITNFLDSKYDELKDKFYFYNAGQAGKIAEFQNKDNILKLAEKHGLQYLKTYVVNVGEIPKDIEYPIITKAIISTIDNWKSDMYICRNEKELRIAYTKIRSPRVLLQKYIEKKNELCLEGTSVNKGNNVLISIASQYNYLLKDSYSPYMTVTNLHNDKVKEALSEMFKDIGFEGIFEVEFLVSHDNQLYFLEINFRNSTWSYASTVAGMPLPIIWASGMLEPSTVVSAYRIIPTPFTAMVEFDDYVKRVKQHKITLIEWFFSLYKCKCRYYLGRNDIRPFISMAKSIIMAKISRYKKDNYEKK